MGRIADIPYTEGEPDISGVPNPEALDLFEDLPELQT